MRKFATVVLVGALALGGVSGCTWTPKTTKGAVIGGATGAAVGAVATKSVGGAVVGGGIGAATGYFVAKNSYPCTKYTIFGHRPYTGWCLR